MTTKTDVMPGRLSALSQTGEGVLDTLERLAGERHSLAVDVVREATASPEFAAKLFAKLAGARAEFPDADVFGAWLRHLPVGEAEAEDSEDTAPAVQKTATPPKNPVLTDAQLVGYQEDCPTLTALERMVARRPALLEETDIDELAAALVATEDGAEFGGDAELAAAWLKSLRGRATV